MVDHVGVSFYIFWFICYFETNLRRDARFTENPVLPILFIFFYFYFKLYILKLNFEIRIRKDAKRVQMKTSCRQDFSI